MVNEARFAWNRVSVIQDGVLPRDEVVKGALDPGVSSGTPAFNPRASPASVWNRPTSATCLSTRPPPYGTFPTTFPLCAGKHSLKMGFDFQLVRVTTDTTLQGRGSFAFNGVYSQDPQDRTRTGIAHRRHAARPPRHHHGRHARYLE